MDRSGSAVESLYRLRCHRGRVALALNYHSSAEVVLGEDVSTEVSGAADPLGVGEAVALHQFAAHLLEAEWRGGCERLQGVVEGAAFVRGDGFGRCCRPHRPVGPLFDLVGDTLGDGGSGEGEACGDADPDQIPQRQQEPAHQGAEGCAPECGTQAEEHRGGSCEGRHRGKGMSPQPGGGLYHDTEKEQPGQKGDPASPAADSILARLAVLGKPVVGHHASPRPRLYEESVGRSRLNGPCFESNPAVDLSAAVLGRFRTIGGSAKPSETDTACTTDADCLSRGLRSELRQDPPGCRRRP